MPKQREEGKWETLADMNRRLQARHAYPHNLPILPLVAAHELLWRHGPVLLPNLLHRGCPHVRNRRLQVPARQREGRKQVLQGLHRLLL